MKKITFFFLLLMILQFTALSTIASTFPILVNGLSNPVLDKLQINKNGRLLVPISFIASALGYDVAWDDNTGIATLSYKNQTISMAKNADVAAINGKKIKMDVPSEISGGRIVVPLRFIAEAFGASINWYEACGSIYISDGNDPVRNVLNNRLPNAKQAIFALADSEDISKAIVLTFEKNNNLWKMATKPISARIGKKGLSQNKLEGDKKTPVGIFNIQRMFGRKANPGTQLPYTVFSSNSYWVDDSSSKYYNTYQTGSPLGRWNSAENLYKVGTMYDYFIVVEYNTTPIVPGKGSAIFIHTWNGSESATSGCIAMERQAILQLSQWLRPNANPVLVCGSLKHLAKEKIK